VDYRTAQLHIDYGRGKAGQVLGPPCTVYRVQGNAAVNYLDAANVVASGLRIARRQTSKKDSLEAPPMGSLFYTLMLDATNFETGDIFIENDPFYGSGATEVDFSTVQFEAYCLAFHGPFKETIGARIDRTATLYRPVHAPTSASSFWEPTAQNMTPVVLSSGVWGLGAVGATASQIPIGLQSFHRVKGPLVKVLPGSTDTLTYFAYMPALNGITPREGDRLVIGGFTNGERYVVQHPYTQQAGLQGSQLVLSREVAAT
jgi:hypothetical protein